MVRKIKSRITKPRFKSDEEFNQFYMTHCFGCRKPLSEVMISKNKQIYRDNPEVRFMMYCDACLLKKKR